MWGDSSLSGTRSPQCGPPLCSRYDAGVRGGRENRVAGTVSLALAVSIQLPGAARGRDDHVVVVVQLPGLGIGQRRAIPGDDAEPGQHAHDGEAGETVVRQRLDFGLAERAADKVSPGRHAVAFTELIGAEFQHRQCGGIGSIRCGRRIHEVVPALTDRGRMFSGRIAPLRPHAIPRRTRSARRTVAFVCRRGPASGSNRHEMPTNVAPVPAVCRARHTARPPTRRLTLRMRRNGRSARRGACIVGEIKWRRRPIALDR